MIRKNTNGEQSAYVSVLQYLNRFNRPISPHELVTVLGKSRVTIHAALRRLTQTGWVTKEGTSPKVYYRAIDPFAKKGSEPLEQAISSEDKGSVKAFIAWCREHGYHVPEVAVEYMSGINKEVGATALGLSIYNHILE